MNWTDHFAERSANIKPSTIREILKLTQQGEVISFAGGLPAPNLFPVEALQAASERVFSNHSRQALQYSSTEGHLPWRQWLAAQAGVDPECVSIVSGSQQALDLVGKVLLNPGDKVAVSSPTYMGALRAWDPYQVEYVTVACDEEGMLPDSLERALSQGVKLLYVIPNFDNPTGVTTSPARRKTILELAERYGAPIFEDDPYGELRFEGERLPSLLELSPEQVIYASTFSKIVAPGFRLAWVIARPELTEMLVRCKQAADLHTATFTQMVAFELLQGDFLPGQIERVRAYYLKQRDHMLDAMGGTFPKRSAGRCPRAACSFGSPCPKGTTAPSS